MASVVDWVLKHERQCYEKQMSWVVDGEPGCGSGSDLGVLRTHSAVVGSRLLI